MATRDRGRFSERQTNDELGPFADARAGNVDRSTVHFDQAFDKGQADSQPSLRRSRAWSTCENKVNNPAIDLAGTPMPLSRTITSTQSPSRRAVKSMRPPGSVYLALIIKQIPKDLGEPSQIGVEKDRLLGQVNG